SLGLGFGHNQRWFVGSQVDYKKGETIQFIGQDFLNKDSYRIAAGGWILPNVNNFRNYFERVIYRYGAFYEKGNLNINDTDINKFGVTFGATLPFKNTSVNRMTGLDVGVELGKRGTLKNNLVNQNYINLTVGLNFADRWFQQRVYNYTMGFLCGIKFKNIACLLGLAIFFISCEEDLATVNSKSTKINFPSQVIYDAKIVQRDSGMVKMRATAPLIEKFELIDTPYVVARK